MLTEGKLREGADTGEMQFACFIIVEYRFCRTGLYEGMAIKAKILLSSNSNCVQCMS